MLGESGGIKADGFALEVGGRVLSRHWNSRRAGWTVIVKVNRASEADGGVILSVSTPGGVVPIETITDYKAPEEGDLAKVKAVRKLLPLVNYPGDGFVEMTRARWDGFADERKTHTARATEEYGAYRYRMSWCPDELEDGAGVPDRREDRRAPARAEGSPAPPGAGMRDGERRRRHEARRRDGA